MKTLSVILLALISLTCNAQSEADLVTWFNAPVEDGDLELLVGHIPEDRWFEIKATEDYACNHYGRQVSVMSIEGKDFYSKITSTGDCIYAYPFSEEFLPGIIGKMRKEKVKEILDENPNVSELFEDSDFGGTYYRFKLSKGNQHLWMSFKFTSDCTKKKHSACLNSVWLHKDKPK